MWSMFQKFILFKRIDTGFTWVQLLWLFIRLRPIYTSLWFFLENIGCLVELICHRLIIWKLLRILRWLLGEAIIIYVDADKFSFVISINH